MLVDQQEAKSKPWVKDELTGAPMFQRPEQAAKLYARRPLSGELLVQVLKNNLEKSSHLLASACGLAIHCLEFRETVGGNLSGTESN